jgi:hypothetical protein
MRKKLFLYFIFCLAVSAVKAEDVVRIIQLQESGTLEAMLGESPDEIDSIVVSGPMNAQDWESLRQCCLYGRLRGIDMSDVIAENDSMPDMALGHMSSLSILKNIRLPKTMRVIGPRALKWCISLEHVELPPNLKRIGYETFYYCISLRHIDLPASLEKIDDSAFYFGRLEDVTIPEGLIDLGSHAFCGNINLKTVRIPARVPNLGWGAFRGCWALEQAFLPPETEVIPALMFQDCEAMKTFEWPSGLREIESNAFESCLIKRIVLPEGVRKIGREAFRHNNALIVLGLPASLESFDQSALMGCERQLKAVHCLATVPPATIGYPYYQEEIRKSIAKATLYVPVGCKEAYSNAPYWHNFGDIVEYDYSEYPTAITEQSLDVTPNGDKYGLDGRVITTTPGGIYIQNGKKYVK